MSYVFVLICPILLALGNFEIFQNLKRSPLQKSKVSASEKFTDSCIYSFQHFINFYPKSYQENISHAYLRF